MRELSIGTDEMARQKLESLERFIADKSQYGTLYYCATHNIHYDNTTGVTQGINPSSISLSWECPVQKHIDNQHAIKGDPPMEGDCKITETESVSRHMRRFV